MKLTRFRLGSDIFPSLAAWSWVTPSSELPRGTNVFMFLSVRNSLTAADETEAAETAICWRGTMRGAPGSRFTGIVPGLVDSSAAGGNTSLGMVDLFAFRGPRLSIRQHQAANSKPAKGRAASRSLARMHNIRSVLKVVGTWRPHGSSGSEYRFDLRL